MATHDSTGVEPTSVVPTTGRFLVRAGLLLGAYLVGLVATAALSVFGAVYANDVLALSLAGQLALVTLALAGVSAAPIVARTVMSAVAARIGSTDSDSPVCGSRPVDQLTATVAVSADEDS